MTFRATDLFGNRQRRRRLPSPLEADLQAAIVKLVRRAGKPGVVIFSIPNEGKRSFGMAGHLKNLGMMPGAADLMILVPGKPALFLEVKAPGRKPREDQMAFAELVGDAGHCWAWVDNSDSALELLQDWGAIRIARAA